MVIVVNTRLLIHGKTDGIGRFAYESLIRITRSHPGDQFVFLFDRNIHEDFIFSENITPVKLLPPARRPWLWNLWFNVSVKGVLRDLQPDLFLSPDGFLPLNTKTKCLPVIHDLNFEHYPQDMPASYSKWYRKKFPLFAKQAARIATVSEFSKNDIATRYGISPGKIDVVYNGASAGFVPLGEERKKEVRKKYTNEAPYFLYIGALHPRKNLERLVRAFGAFRKNSETKTKLVITGGNYWKYDSLQKAVDESGAKEEIVFTGRLGENELHAVTGAARALAYVPYFEGFGIPIVEAMACDVPVLAANVSCMPEVGGDAVLYADPLSENSIADALARLDKDEALRNSLVEKAKVQRQKFSWDRTASLLWDSIEKTVNAR
ncbi:MAG TPA: glycosyltransferase family 1 protein [Bacteroidia bacterium]|nr:glycosyltransferase family 1 protein [Bacteroidia bacterium]